MKKSIISLMAIVLFTATSIQADDFLRWVTGCNGIQGSGDLVTETRDLDEFTRIEAKGSTDIFVTVGDEQKVTVTFDDNLVDFIVTDVRRKTLEVYCEESYSSRRPCRVEITVPSLESVRLSGSGDMEIYDLQGEMFEYTISGSGDLRMDGEIDELDIRVSGSGDVDARDLKAKDAYVKVSGSGDVKVYTSESFEGRVSGSGDINVYGNPEHVSRRVSGSGDIRKRR